MEKLTRSYIDAAYRRIFSHVARTPFTKAPFQLIEQCETPGHPQVEMYLKTEQYQHMKIFKYRGALNKLLQLSDSQLRKGFITYSTEVVRLLRESKGNHAIALAAASQLLAYRRGFSIPVKVFMSTETLKDKIDMVRQLGASLHLVHGGGLDKCRHEAMQVAHETHTQIIPSCDDPDITAGHATVATEISQQAVEICGQPLNAIIAPVGGGSLLAGVATWFHGSTTQIWAAEPMTGGPNLEQSLRRGRLLQCDGTQTIADGQRSSIGEKTWSIFHHQSPLAGCISVTESSILKAMRLYANHYDDLIEPSSAVAIAGAMSGLATGRFHKREDTVLRIGIILTGGNVSRHRFRQLIASNA